MKLHIFSILFLILIIFISCSSLNDSSRNNALEALENGYYQTAIHYANEILSEDSLNTQVYLIRAKAYSRLYESHNAYRDFEAIIKIQPDFDVYYNRGLEYLKDESYSDALEDFNNAISYQSSNSDAYFSRAYTKYLLDDMEGAIEDYKKVIEIDSTSFKAFINIGNILGSLGYGEQAIEKFSEAIKLQPYNPDGYFNRGNQKLIMDDLEGGIDDIEKSLSLDSKNIDALLLLAELKLKTSDNLGSFEILNKVLETEENPKALFMRGVIFLKLEDRTNACTDFHRSGELGYFEAYEFINKYCITSKKRK